MLNFVNAITTNDTSENLVKASSIEESFTNQTLKFLTDLNFEYNRYQKELYFGITESTKVGNIYEANIIIHEAFSDFFNSIKEIFKKIIDFIKNIVNKFISLFTKKDKKQSKVNDKYSLEYICKYCEDSTETTTFNKKGYNFTIDKDVPLIEEITTSSAEISLNNVNDVEKTKQNLIKLKNKLNNIVNEKNDYFDKLRGKILNWDSSVSKEDFQNSLFRTFRDLQENEVELKIDKDSIRESISNLKNSDTIKERVKEDEKKLIKKYKKNLDELEKSIKNYKVDNVELMTLIDQINKLDVTRVKKICEMHCLAFSTKLEAIIARNKQDKMSVYEYYTKILKKEGVI